VIAAWKLACAYALDWLVGDPEWFPHPVRLIGAAVDVGCNRLLRHESNPARELIHGAALSAVVVSWAAATAQSISKLGTLFEILLACSALATRNLLDEAGSVLNGLDTGDLALARTRLSRIVGRDTVDLNEEEIVRAVIETAAESTCDGIVAPMLYLTLGGVPAALAYKAVNTLDSMIGHREAPFTYFGRFAARLDDVCNFVPARVAAASIVLAGTIVGEHGPALKVWCNDGEHHASPNAGHVEAAIAGTLNVRLGGENSYDGHIVFGNIINSDGVAPTREKGRAALRVVAIASGLVFGAAFFLAAWNGIRLRTADSHA
jgi:adenosylcobinamide-phosphate synthase